MVDHSVVLHLAENHKQKLSSEVSYCRNKLQPGRGKQGKITIENPWGCFASETQYWVEDGREFQGKQGSITNSLGIWAVKAKWYIGPTICGKTETGFMWINARGLESDNTETKVKRGLALSGFFSPPQNTTIYLFFHSLRDIWVHAMTYMI